ncbi:radical SAM protein [Sphingobium sp. C100]|uniref:4Fe-4S cluster-binding domain-containing protein n=1 Tax=Sphingobium sp. C100 TaxID=1207055 RepID=UPI0003D6157C|nr:4Fe-4S cluster-binding domain-containing protein [Sphingobium sp. C100]ETI64277.1 radical SAM protein [Sphingobium sp. C100]
MQMSLSRLHFPVTSLGTGRRIGLWFQGCSIRCPGCISVDTWEQGVGLVPIADVVARISALAGEADGLTISGGEPFEQPEALAAILAAWRGVSKRSVLVFTGREMHEVEAWLAINPGLVDAIITGPFRSDLAQTVALRGSDNQKLHVLSPLGRELRIFDRPLGDGDRRLDIMFDEDGDAWVAGIPARGDIGRLRRALASSGHHAITSDAHGMFGA